jgi:predicted secreted protein
MTIAYKAFGTLLKRGDGASPETFQEVKNCGDIEGPSTKKDFEEITNHSSAAEGGYKEYVPTLKDGDTLKCSVNWLPSDAVHIGIQQDLDGDVLRNWQLVFPTTPVATFAFAAYVSAFNPKAPVKGIVMRELELKITGAVTVTTA